jgi:hypothetical protein
MINQATDLQDAQDLTLAGPVRRDRLIRRSRHDLCECPWTSASSVPQPRPFAAARWYLDRVAVTVAVKTRALSERLGLLGSSVASSESPLLTIPPDATPVHRMRRGEGAVERARGGRRTPSWLGSGLACPCPKSTFAAVLAGIVVDAWRGRRLPPHTAWIGVALSAAGPCRAIYRSRASKSPVAAPYLYGTDDDL